MVLILFKSVLEFYVGNDSKRKRILSEKLNIHFSKWKQKNGDVSHL